MSMKDDTSYRLRVADDQLQRALRTSGAVQIIGPKWCGKTTTAARVANSERYFQDPDYRASYARLAQEEPSRLLIGDKPLLLDEWQDVPQVWDAVRFAVDRSTAMGQFILTGSSLPSDMAQTQIRHSGTGRFSRVTMRPMSLLESGESSGEVSLNDFFAGVSPQGMSHQTRESMAHAVTRGGWPASVVNDDAYALRRAIDYAESIIESDLSRVDGIEKNPKRVRLLMRSLARNESSQATMTTLQADMSADEGRISTNTIAQYLTALQRLFVIEDQPPWGMAVRSKVVQRTAPVRRYCDPSIAAALLRLTPDKLMVDANTFGLLFESLCVRDLRIYAEACDASVYHYRDSRGLECDAIIERGDGAWGAIEIKLGTQRFDEAKRNLLKIGQEVRSQHGGAPSFLMVLTNDEMAYRDHDGIYWVPIGCLKP